MGGNWVKAGNYYWYHPQERLPLAGNYGDVSKWKQDGDSSQKLAIALLLGYVLLKTYLRIVNSCSPSKRIKYGELILRSVIKTAHV